MKILGSDYDGTLNHGGITEGKLAAIRQWRAAGHKFGIVSGRSSNFLQTLLQAHPAMELDFFAACSGGYITDREGNVICESRCDQVPAVALIEDLIAWGCRIIHVSGEVYHLVIQGTEGHPDWVYREKTCFPEELPPVAYFHQVSVELDSPQSAAAVVERIRQKYGALLNPLQNHICIDIVPAGVDKAQGLRRLTEIYGCRQEDVVVVGDNINDLDMIRAFRSYAMASGVELVKNSADEIVSDVTDLIKKELQTG